MFSITFLLIIIIPIPIMVLLYLQNKKKENSAKILNVYSQPGKWYYLKYCAIYVVLWLRRLKTNNLIKVPDFERKLESTQTLSDHAKAYDATFVHGVSQDGFYLCGGLERRHAAKSSGLFYIALPDYGLLESEKLPSTALNTDIESINSMNSCYSAEGICLRMIEPMRKWQITFSGKMRARNSSKSTCSKVSVELDTIFSSNKPYFLLERDLYIGSLASALAREPWTKEFFQSLKETHPIRYEQMGHLNGTLIVDGNEYKLKDMASFRDHSYGFKRDWSLIYRYIYHMLYLLNGTSIIIGLVSQPSTVSLLEIGYVVHNHPSRIDVITSCDLKLYQHGENGNPPSGDLAFSFRTQNANTDYDVRICKTLYESVHYKGDGEARLIERFVECEVNGVKGRGIAEWHYNINNNKALF